MFVDFKQRVKKCFDQAASSYEEYANIQKYTAENFRFFLPKFDYKAKILEIGCGTGFLSKIINNYYPRKELFVSDISLNMVTASRDRLPNQCAFVVLDGEHLPFKNKFDLIVSNLAAQWFEQPEKSINIIQSFLEEKGTFLFSTLGPYHFHEWYESLNKVTSRSLPYKEAYYKPSSFNKEIILKTKYSSGWDFLTSLKKIGANATRYEKTLSPRALKDAIYFFEKTYNSTVTQHIYLISLKKNNTLGSL